MSPHSKHRIPLFLFGVLAGSLYLVTLGYDFAYDDTLQILLNPQVSEATLSLHSLLSLFSSPTPPGNLYRPVTTLTYQASYLISGLLPVLFHLGNICIYVAVCLLVPYLLAPILPSQRSTVIATLFFIVHPLHVEAVANVIGRAEMLAAFGVMGSCLAVRKAFIGTSGNTIAGWASLAGALFLLAALCKESAIAALPLILLYPYFDTHLVKVSALRLVQNIPSTCTLTASAAIALLMRYYALGDNFILRSDGKVWIENPLFHLPLSERIIPGMYVLGEYLRLMILPLRQSADYSMTPELFLAKVFSLQGVLSLTCVGALILLSIVMRSRQVLFCVLWILCSFALTVNIITPIGTVMGERLTFLPSLGGCALIAIMLERIAPSTPMRSALVVSWLTVFILLTVNRVPVWQSNAALFLQTTSDNPVSPKAWYNLGVEMVLNDPKSHEAEAHFRQALELFPTYLLPTRALADIMLARKDLGRLEYWYRRILELTPEDTVVKSNLEQLTALKEGSS